MRVVCAFLLLATAAFAYDKGIRAECRTVLQDLLGIRANRDHQNRAVAARILDAKCGLEGVGVVAVDFEFDPVFGDPRSIGADV